MAVPAQASAVGTDVFLSGGKLNVHAQSGSGMAGFQVSYQAGPQDWQVIGAGATAGGGCNQDSSAVVSCPESGEDVDVEFANVEGSITFAVADSFLDFDTDIELGTATDNVTGTEGIDTIHYDGAAGSTTAGDDITALGGNDTITDVSQSSDLIDGGDGGDTIDAGSGNNILNGGDFAGDDTDGDDVITGGSDFDDIDGGAGADTLNGGADNDKITGGPDGDIINAGPGNDGTSTFGVDGEAGNDTINGGDGEDILAGGADTDTLNGENEDDVLDGGDGSDSLNGGPGDDLFPNSAGPDAFNGGTNGTAGGQNGALGDEVDYSVGTGTAVTADIDGTADDGRSCPATCEGDNVATDIENLTGDSGADTLTGGTNANILDGNSGNDTLAGGQGAGADGGDRFNDASGTDTVTYNPASGTARTGNLIVDIDGTGDDGTAGEADDLETNIENVIGGSGTDNITGSTLVNDLRGGPGTAADTLSGGAANDTLFGGLGTNTGPDGADTFNGDAHTTGDTVSYAGRTDAITADLDGTADDGGTGEGDDINTTVENLTGGSTGDTLTGNASANTIDGAGGNDDLAGGTGAAADGADSLIGGSGTEDEVSYASRTDGVNTGTADDLDVDLDGVADDGFAGELDNVGATVENVIGGAGDDDLTGNTGANELTGNGGDDELKGGTSVGADGADAFSGGTGGTIGGQNGFAGDEAEYVDRTSAVNISIGGAADGAAGENDSIGADIEILSSGSGADTLTGSGAPSEFFFGRDGNDTMRGGTGTGPDGIDRFNGGNGVDNVSYSTRTDPITAVIDDPAVISPPATTDNDDIGSDVETVFGGTANDTLIGNDADNTLSGNGGDDTLRGGQQGVDGADEYVGGANGAGGDTVSFSHRGDDVSADIGGGDDDVDLDDVQTTVENVTGGGGDDTLIGNGSANVLSGGAGDDNLAGGQVPGPDGADTFIGGTDGTPGGAHSENKDLVTYFNRTDDISANLTSGVGGAAGEADVIDATMERATGGSGDDTLTGDAEANLLEGNNGDDTFAGGQGAGPDGADTFNAGGQGVAGDTVTYATRTDDVTATIGGAADVDGDDIQSAIDNVTGGSGDDGLTGDADANRLEGGGGQDALSALGGADRIEARDGFADTVDCGTEADTAVLDEGNLDTLSPPGTCETLDQPPLQAPETTILTGPDNPTTRRKAIFTFEADEAATFRCKIDSRALRACTSPKEYRNLTPGRHKVTVIATDLVGQADPTPARYRWRITN